MGRVPLVVVVVGALVWGVALLDVGKPRARRAPDPEPEPVAAAAPIEAPAARPAPRPSRSVELQPAVTEVETSSEVVPRAAPRVMPGLPLRRNPSTSAPAELPPPSHAARERERGALSTATGELGEGSLSPEYVEMERAYAHEPRDGAWAEAQERNLRELFASSTLGSELTLVNCQETLCRLTFESDDFELYARLLDVPGLREATGLERSSPYSHRSGQLSVYFTRRSPAGEPH